MLRVPFYLVLIGLTLSVLFRKISEVTTSRSRWTVTFVIDLDPHAAVLGRIEANIDSTMGIIHSVMDNNPPAASGLINNFRQLTTELRTLNETHFGLVGRFAEYKKLHPRAKRSLLPFVGQAFSCLFGRVYDGDLESIRRNLRSLRDNQLGVAHAVQEGLSLLNVSRVQISENRQTLNVLVMDIETLDHRVANVTQVLHNRILRIETMLPMYLQLDAVVQWIKLSMQKALLLVEHLQLQLNMLSIGN